ncbi:MAG: glycoside hydrolase family 57 protein [Methanosarcinales archaeon]
MASICIYFQVHQPHRLRWFWPGDQLHGFDRYFDNSANKEIFNKVANKCYWPTNNIILELIDRYKDFKVSFSITGTLLNQCEKWDPDLLETFKQMANSGQIEFLDETYYHSLASLFEDKTEFKEQILQHRDSMRSLFGYTPKVFRNTELLYNNSIAKIAEELGYKAILTEGIERVLEWRSPNFVYKAKNSNIRVLMRNYRLSDDIGYRFSARWWEEYPLTAEKWATWASGVEGEVLNIFMDYETFGEHQWPDTGIFQFLRAFPEKVLERRLSFITPSEAVQKYNPVAEIDVGDFSTISWADIERDTSAWLGNDMQRRCFEEIKLLKPYVKKTQDQELINIWKTLQTSDHYYYMCTKWMADGDVHSYFSVHASPYDAAINFMAIVMDFKEKVFEKLKEVRS